MAETIGFLLNKIVTEQFAVIESAFKDGDDVQFGINSKYGIFDDEKVLSVFIAPAFYQNKQPFLVLEVICHFEIEESAWNEFLNKDKSKLTFPLNFVRHVTMLAVGTARGILHAKTENTPFNEFILPTINLNETIKSSVVFNLSED